MPIVCTPPSESTPPREEYRGDSSVPARCPTNKDQHHYLLPKSLSANKVANRRNRTIRHQSQPKQRLSTEWEQFDKGPTASLEAHHLWAGNWWRAIVANSKYRHYSHEATLQFPFPVTSEEAGEYLNKVSNSIRQTKKGKISLALFTHCDEEDRLHFHIIISSNLGHNKTLQILKQACRKPRSRIQGKLTHFAPLDNSTAFASYATCFAKGKIPLLLEWGTGFRQVRFWGGFLSKSRKSLISEYWCDLEGEQQTPGIAYDDSGFWEYDPGFRPITRPRNARPPCTNIPLPSCRLPRSGVPQGFLEVIRHVLTFLEHYVWPGAGPLARTRPPIAKARPFGIRIILSFLT